jgi:hypothetical protein
MPMKNVFKSFIVTSSFIAGVFGSVCLAQTPQFEAQGTRQNPTWVTFAETRNYTYLPQSSAVNGQGSIYTTGLVDAYFKFDGIGFLRVPMKSSSGNGSQDQLRAFYLTKLNNNGKFEWIRFANSEVSGLQVRVDSKGFIYTLGSAQKKLKFQSGDTTFVDCGTDSTFGFIFLNKCDSTGTLLFTKVIQAKEKIQPLDFLLNRDGGFTIAGTYDFRKPNAPMSGRKSYLLLRIDKNLNILWNHKGGEFNDSKLESVSEDANGNLYASGSFKDSTLIQTGMMRTDNVEEGFVLKMNNRGNLEWKRNLQPGRYGKTRIMAVACTSKGNVYLQCQYSRQLYFSDQLEAQTDITSQNGRDQMAIVLMNSKGTVKWVNHTALDFLPIMGKLLVDEKDNVIACGNARGLNFTTKGKQFFSMIPKAVSDPFFLSYNELGEMIWLKAYSGSRSSEVPNLCFNKNNIYLSGSVGGKMTIGDTVIEKKQTGAQNYWLSFSRNGSTASEGVKIEIKKENLIDRVSCSCQLEEMGKKGYAASLPSLIEQATFDSLSQWQFTGSPSGLQSLYLRGLQQSSSTEGAASFYDMKLSPTKAVHIRNRSHSLQFNLTPCQNLNAEIPFTINIQHAILQYRRDFEYETFNRTTEEYYSILRTISEKKSKDILSYLCYQRDNSGFKEDLKTFNKKYNLKLTPGENHELFASDFFKALTVNKLNEDTVLLDYFIKTDASVHTINQEESNLMSDLFYDNMGQFSIESIDEIIYPQYDVMIGIPYLGVEFGNALFKRWDPALNKPMEGNSEFTVLLKVKHLNVDSKKGFRAPIESTCFPKAIILGTDIVLDCKSVEWIEDLFEERSAGEKGDDEKWDLIYRKYFVKDQNENGFFGGLRSENCMMQLLINGTFFGAKGSNVYFNRTQVMGEMVLDINVTSSDKIVLKASDGTDKTMLKAEFEKIVRSKKFDRLSFEYNDKSVKITFLKRAAL